MQDMIQRYMISERLTVGIPVRIDSKERKANLLSVVKYLAVLQCRIIVLEADTHPQADDICNMEVVDYTFVKDTNQVFHRTHYINNILQMSQTDVVAIWDTDVLVDYSQIIEAFQLICQGATISYPYDGRFVMLSEQLSIQTRRMFDFEYLRNLKIESFLGRKLCGGAYLVHKQRYQLCGGENEHFTSWGPEDAERFHRVAILGYIAKHINKGELFHLYHPRGLNSGYLSREKAKDMREEFIKICCMSPEELKLYMKG